MSQNRSDNLENIIAAAKNRESKAQKNIYDLFSPVMMGICYRYMNDTETAKDMLQEGFIRVFTKIDSYAGTGSFEGWLRRVFVTTCLEHLRQKDALRMSTSLEEYSQAVPSAGAEVISKMTVDELLQLVAGLAEGYRTVFNLYAIEGFSHAEIAEMLGITEVTSRTQFMRARKILQESVLKWDNDGKRIR
jgi:RNA polymerase sigma-70 factor (ECF subfamily)